MYRNTRIAEAIRRNGTDERRIGVLSDIISEELTIVVDGYTKDKVIALASLTEACAKYFMDYLCDRDDHFDDKDLMLAAMEETICEQLADDGSNRTFFTTLCRDINGPRGSVEDMDNGNDHCKCRQDRNRRCQYHQDQDRSGQNRHHQDHIGQYHCQQDNSRGHTDDLDNFGPSDTGSQIPEFRTGLEILTDELIHSVPEGIKIVESEDGHMMAVLVYDLGTLDDPTDGTLDGTYDEDHWDDPEDYDEDPNRDLYPDFDEDHCPVSDPYDDDDEIDPDELINDHDRYSCDTGPCGRYCELCPCNSIPLFVYEDGQFRRIPVRRNPHARVRTHPHLQEEELQPSAGLGTPSTGHEHQTQDHDRGIPEPEDAQVQHHRHEPELCHKGTQQPQDPEGEP